MTTPLWCLLFAALLPYVCSGVGAYYRSKLPGGVDNHNPRKQAQTLEGSGARAYAAQQNAWEALAVFTAAVVINHLAQGAPEASGMAALLFIITRLLHMIFYIVDQDKLRSLSFVVGFGACIWLIRLGVSGP